MTEEKYTTEKAKDYVYYNPGSKEQYLLCAIANELARIADALEENNARLVIP